MVKKAVLRAFYRSIVWLVVLGLLLTQILWGFKSAIAQESPSAEALPPEKLEETFPLASDEQAAPEPALKSDSEKKPAASRTQKSYPEPPQEYDREALERFDADLYGD